MKRFKSIFSLLMVLCIVLGPCMVSAYAADAYGTSISQEELIALAIRHFPEHTESIMNALNPSEILMMSMPEAGLGSVVVDSTKDISDDEQLRYVEYDTGTIFLGFSKYWNVTNSSSGTGYRNVTASLHILSPWFTDAFFLSGFSYSIAQYNYDSITNKGTALIGTSFASVSAFKQTENPSGPAYVSFVGVFNGSIPDSFLSATIKICVGGDSCVVYLNGNAI